MKLRGAVKKGKAIEKQRAELEAQLSSLQEQVVHVQPMFSQNHRKTDCLLWRTSITNLQLMSPFAGM